jgi:hypothetical protein
VAVATLVGGDLPLVLGGGVAVGAAPTDVDVLIDRTPFWLAISEQSPYQRETAQFQRDQVDQAPEAGEQSLAGWWSRSQMSWHYGAGLNYLDTTTQPEAADRARFRTSRNIDCWTPGVLKRLNGTTVSRAHAETAWVEATETGLVMARPSQVEVWNGTTWTQLNYGSAFPVRGFCTDGSNYYVANIDGVFRGSLSGGTGTKLFELPDTDVPMALGWVKQRLMLGHGNKVYSLDTAGPALPTAKLTHPNASWRWTSFADSPNGVLATGYAGLNSAIFSFQLTTLADAPVLNTGVALLSMPGGERILSTQYYLGSLLVLGTNRGIRVCPFDSYYGTMSMGPLTVETEGPVTAIGGYDRFLYAGTRVNGESSLVRVDLSAPIDEQGHYAWAPDMVLPDGVVTSLAFAADGTKQLTVTGVGLVAETGAPTADEAWIETARIRMATAEDKHWMHGLVRGSFSVTSPITTSVTTNGVDWRSVYSSTVNAERFDLRSGSSEWIALRFALAGGATLSSYQLQALPAGKRQRLLSLPLSITDFQLTRSGVEVGYSGWALERLTAVELLEEAGAEITVSAPALFPQAISGVIEKLTYVQTADPGDRGTGTGGVLQVVLRTVT